MNAVVTLSACAVSASIGVMVLPTPAGITRFTRRGWFTHSGRFTIDQRLIPVLGGGLIGALAASLSQRWSATPLLISLGALCGYLYSSLRRQTRRHRVEREIAEQLPVVIEMLALAVSAGEAPASALARICGHGDGVLLRALRGAISDLALGSTLVQALAVVRTDLSNTELDRFIDGITIGQERGTPLVEILHAQALDTRERQRRALIEKAASGEVAMMVPVVFLIMPITIIFALFPSFYRMTWI